MLASIADAVHLNRPLADLRRRADAESLAVVALNHRRPGSQQLAGAN
jgi:hypothetical protein